MNFADQSLNSKKLVISLKNGEYLNTFLHIYLKLKCRINILVFDQFIYSFCIIYRPDIAEKIWVCKLYILSREYKKWVLLIKSASDYKLMYQVPLPYHQQNFSYNSFLSGL